MLRKIISLTLSLSLLFQYSGFAQGPHPANLAQYLNQMPRPIQDRFRPLHMRYFSYNPQSNDFDLLLDKGDEKGLKDDELKEKTAKLMEYFKIGLALPNDKFWVNLRPDAPDEIIDPLLEKTDIGRILLEADLQLKKDTAAWTSPQTKEGREYWDKLYKKAGELFGTENITIPTVTRPWIVPAEVIINTSPNAAYIYKASLKVMLEEDYLNNQKTEKPKNQKTEIYGFSDPRLKELNQYSTQLIKELIIPQLTKEVNTSRRYAQLRQVFYSLALAQWFKQKYGSLGSARASGISAAVNSYINLIDSGNLDSLTSSQPWDKQDYFRQYRQSFQNGEYNLKEPVYGMSGQNIRSYTSGGVLGDTTGARTTVEANSPLIPKGSDFIDPDRIDGNQRYSKSVSSAALSQKELERLYKAQGGNDWGEIQSYQEALKQTFIATYDKNWQIYEEAHKGIKPIFDINNPGKQVYFITPDIADEYNIKGHYKGFIKKSNASTAGIRAFTDILHSENPSKMYNDMFLSLLIMAEAEFLKDIQHELAKNIPKTQEEINNFASEIRQEIDAESVKIIEEIYNMPLEMVIPFLRDNVVKLVGGEVRVHTAKWSEMEARILAEQGIKVITLESYSDSVPIYMYSFLTYLLGASGATHYTSSHSANYLYGRKSLSPDGAQLLPDVYENYREILGRIIEEEVYKKGGYKVELCARNNTNIISRLSYKRMVKLYKSILNISNKDVELINEATKKGHRVVLNALNGSTWKTLRPLLEELGINADVFIPVMEEEDPLFRTGYVVTKTKDGLYAVEHLGMDTTLSEVVRTIPYNSLLKGLPVGTRVYECDPDSDRFVLKQIIANTPENVELLKEYALSYYHLEGERILVAPNPNKAFLVLDIVDYETMQNKGTWDDYWSLYYVTYVSSRAWVEFAESVPGLLRAMAQVGFKNLTALQRTIEDWYFNRPKEHRFSFNDQLGRTVTVTRDKKIRIHSKQEESGGRVAGMNKSAVNILGQKVLAMPEKSAADSLLSELLFSSRLFLDNNTAMQGDYFFIDFMRKAFQRYNLKSKVDVRIDLAHGNQGEIANMKYEYQQKELQRCDIIKTNFNNFFFSLAKAVRDGQVTLEKAKEVLTYILPKYKSTWQKLIEITLTEELLAGGMTRPEGVPMIFGPGALVTELDFRPSGTDPLKSKIYVDAERLDYSQIEEIKKDFSRLAEYDLYEVLKRYGIAEITPKPDFISAGISLKTLQASSAITSADDFMGKIDYLMRMLKILDYPRVVQTFKTSVDPVALVNGLSQKTGKPIENILNILKNSEFFKVLAANYLVKNIVSPNKGEYKSKKIVVTVGDTGYKTEGVQDDMAGEPLSDYLLLMREEAGNTPFVFRDNMEQYVGRFLNEYYGGFNNVKPAKPDLSGTIDMVGNFLKDVELGKIRYVITSGIGANEMYSHQLAAVLNQSFRRAQRDLRWIVVNNPAHLDPDAIPPDAVSDNTIVFEMSRSGSTKETVDFFNATSARFKQRIVAANAGALKKSALELAKDKDARVLIIDDTPGDIGGRQMNRKTLMVYVPLFIALACGLESPGYARRRVAGYVSGLWGANEELAYKNKLVSPAVALAEFLLRQRASGRNKFSVLYDDSLGASAKELFQLINEGANKNIAGGTNDNILIKYSLRQDAARYMAVFSSLADSQVALFILNSASPDYNLHLEYIKSLEQKGIPCAVISVNISRDGEFALTQDLRTMPRLSALLQDMVVYFTFITNQDANSNPAVKFVREITAAIFDIIKEKRAGGTGEVGIGFDEVINKISQKQNMGESQARKTINERGVKPDDNPQGLLNSHSALKEFKEAITAVSKSLALSEKEFIALLLSAASKSVLQTDVGEAGGSKISEIGEAFARSGINDSLGVLSPDPKIAALEKQIVFKNSPGMKISVAAAKQDSFSVEGNADVPQVLADYFYKIYEQRGKNWHYTALSFMEIDANNTLLQTMATNITKEFADLGIAVPLLPLPGVAHTGIEAAMSHPEEVFNIAIMYTNAYGPGLGTSLVEPGVTIDDATYVYGMSNVIRMALGGTPSIIFEVRNKKSLDSVKWILEGAITKFKERISSSALEINPGGVDLTNIGRVTQARLGRDGLNFLLDRAVKINLAQEEGYLARLIDAQVLPLPQRVMNFVSSSSLQGYSREKAQDMLVNYLRLEERLAVETPDELKQFLSAIQPLWESSETIDSDE